MCGIGGVFSCRDSSGVASSIAAAIAHRGPDDAGRAVLCDANGESVGEFCHARLAIIDTSWAGHQPMLSRDGRLILCYNGEIYNYAELREQLAAEGVEFQSHSDSEVLLLGWARHGFDFLPRLRGMFAFSMWDRDLARGYLVRDAFGIKPLYASELDGSVMFASEVRALVAAGVPRVMSAPGVESFLATGSVSEPFTIIDGVTALPPGCVVDVTSDGDRFTMGAPIRFGRPLSASPQLAPDTRNGIRAALEESVAYHLVSDVPVGVFLSGGIDSTAVAGLASKLSPHPVETFTVVFREAEYSEAAPAREAAKRFGANHHEVPLTSKDLLEALPGFFAAMDQPSIDGLNTFVVSRAVHAAGFKVVLSGLGGDELFGGYPSFRRAQRLAPLWKLPKSARTAARRLGTPLAGPRGQQMLQLLDGDNPAAASYHASRTLFGDGQLRKLRGTAGRMKRASAAPDDTDVSGLSLMQEVSLYETTGYMRNTLLRDSDVFSMAHGLELRVPFVDAAVAMAAFASAAASDKSPLAAKGALIESVRDLLSPDALTRPKQGFTLPFEKWMRNEMQSEVDSVLSSEWVARSGLNPESVNNIWKQFLAKRAGVNWSRPWALYTLARWASVNGVTEVAGASH